MLMLALTCLRLGDLDADVADAVMRGDVQDALRIGLGRLDRTGGDVPRHAVLGQVLGQALLGAGREEQAEELFQKQLRLYEGLPRAHVRWLSSMDLGFMSLHLNRPGRAAESFNVVADCNGAPLPLRIEALAGMAWAVHSVGEHRRALRTLVHAMHLAEGSSPAVRHLLDATQLELAATGRLRHYDDPLTAPPPGGGLDVTPLQAMATAMSHLPVVSRRLAFLAALGDRGLATAGSAGRVFDELRWWHERRLAHMEELARIEAALVLVDHGHARTANDVLGALAADDVRLQHHRHAIELRFIVSKLHALRGRHVDALRCFRQHASQAMTRLRCELQRVPYSRFLELQERAEQGDADQLRLPLRYRRAYQFIVDHLDERTLSVRRVASHVDVTERALQMAFRTHLGLSPAEVIRRLRLSRIRTELQHAPVHDRVLSVGARWAMGNRSTLVRNYRRQFDETPGATPPAVARRDQEDDVRDVVVDET